MALFCWVQASPSVNLATTFNGAIDSTPGTSQFDLHINCTTGALFEGNISANNALNSLAVSNGATVFAGAAMVNTIGDQNYSAAVTVDNDLLLNSTTGSITFFKPLDSGATPANLTINAATQVVFGQTLGSAVGSVQPFGQLIVTVPATTISNPTSIELNGNVTTVGDQIYNGPVILSSVADLNTAVGAVVDFTSTIDGAQTGAESLTIGNTNVAGDVIFGGDIGLTNSLVSPNVSATQVFINGNSVVTDGAQTYSGDVSPGRYIAHHDEYQRGWQPRHFQWRLDSGATYATATDTLNVTGTLAFNSTSGTSTLYSTLNSQGSGVGAQAFGQIIASSADLTGVNLSLTFATTPTIGSNSYTIVQGSGNTSFSNVTADHATKFFVSGVDFTADDSTSDLLS